MTRWQRLVRFFKIGALLAALVLAVAAVQVWRLASSGAIYERLQRELAERYGLSFTSKTFVIAWRAGRIDATGVKVGRPDAPTAVAVDHLELTAPFYEVWQGTAGIERVNLGAVEIDLAELAQIRATIAAADRAARAGSPSGGSAPTAVATGDTVASATLRVATPTVGLPAPVASAAPTAGSAAVPLDAPAETNLARIPLKELIVRDLRLRQGFTQFDIDEVEALLMRVSNEAHLSVRSRRLPWGGDCALRVLVTPSLGSGAVQLSCRDVRAEALPLPLERFAGPEVTGATGKLDIDLEWRGNPSQRGEQLARRLIADVFTTAPIRLASDDPLLEAIWQEATATVGLRESKADVVGVPVRGQLLLKRDLTGWRWVASAETATATVMANGLLRRDGQQILHTAAINIDAQQWPAAWYARTGVDKVVRVPGAVGACITLSGPLADPDIDLTLAVPRLEVEAIPVASFGLALALHRDQRAGTVHADLGRLGNFTATAVAASATAEAGQRRPESWTFSGRLAKMQLEELGKHLKENYRGVGAASFTVFWSPGERLRYRADIDVSEPRAYHLLGRRLTGTVEGTGPAVGSDTASPTWAVRNLDLETAGGGHLTMRGVIDPQGFAAAIIANDIELATLLADPRGWRARLFGASRLSGPLTDPVLEFEPVILRNIAVADVRVAEIVAAGSLAGEQLTCTSIRVRDTDGFNATGTVALNLRDADGTTIGGLEFTALDLGRLPAALRDAMPGVQLSGQVAGRLKRSIEASVPLARLEFAGGTVRELHIGSCTARILGGQVEIETLNMAGLGGALRVNGRLTAEEGLTGSVRGERLTLTAINTAQRAVPGVTGQIDLEGEIAINKKNRDGYLRVIATDLAWRDRSLGTFGGEILISGDHAVIQRGLLDRLGIKIDGDLRLAPPFAWQAKLGMKNTDLAFLPAAYGLESFSPGDLIVDGSVSGAGELLASFPSRIEGVIDALTVRQGRETLVANRPLRLLYQNGRWEVRSFELKYRQGVFGIEGLVDPKGAIALALTGRDFSARALARLVKRSSPKLRGTLSLKGGVTGTLADPKFSAQLLLKDFGPQASQTIPLIDTRCIVTRQGVRLAPLQVRLPSTALSAHGDIGFNGLGIGKIDMLVEVASGPIKDLTYYFPGVFSQAQGSLAGRMHVVGDWPTPALEGNLKLIASAVAIPGMRRPFTDVQVGVSHRDGRLILAPVTARVGKGVVNGTGEVDFRSASPSIKLDVSGKNLDMTARDLEFRRVGLTVSVRGEPYRPVVRGAIKIPRGRITLSDRLVRPSQAKLRLPFESLDYVFDVDAPGNVWLRNSFMNAEMRGKFRVLGSLHEHHFQGDVQTIRGYLQFQRRRFDIDNGEVHFGELHGNFDPTFYVRSSTTIQNYRINLNLEGRISSFSSRLYSSPPLAEGDVFALLALGRSMEQIQAASARNLLEGEVLEGLKSAYIGGLLSSTFTNSLNLDEFYYGTVFDQMTGASRAFLRLGKYLSKSIFFVYEGTLSNEDKKTYIFEYRLPKGLKFSAEIEKPRDWVRVGVTYDWQF